MPPNAIGYRARGGFVLLSVDKTPCMRRKKPPGRCRKIIIKQEENK